MTDETTDIVPQGPDQPPPGKKIKVDCNDPCSWLECKSNLTGDDLEIQVKFVDRRILPPIRLEASNAIKLGRWLLGREDRDGTTHSHVIFDDHKDVNLADLKGIAPGITGGLSSEEFVRRQRQGECFWTKLDGGLPGSNVMYETGCKRHIDWNEYSPPSDAYSFCPFCGGELKVLKPTTDGEPT